MAQPGRGEVQGRLPVGKGADHARAPPDLAQDALERIVGADAPPMLLWEGIVGQRLVHAPSHDPVEVVLDPLVVNRDDAVQRTRRNLGHGGSFSLTWLRLATS